MQKTTGDRAINCPSPRYFANVIIVPVFLINDRAAAVTFPNCRIADPRTAYTPFWWQTEGIGITFAGRVTDLSNIRLDIFHYDLRRTLYRTERLDKIIWNISRRNISSYGTYNILCGHFTIFNLRYRKGCTSHLFIHR